MLEQVSSLALEECTMPGVDTVSTKSVTTTLLMPLASMPHEEAAIADVANVSVAIGDIFGNAWPGLAVAIA